MATPRREHLDKERPFAKGCVELSSTRYLYHGSFDIRRRPWRNVFLRRRFFGSRW